MAVVGVSPNDAVCRLKSKTSECQSDVGTSSSSQAPCESLPRDLTNDDADDGVSSCLSQKNEHAKSWPLSRAGTMRGVKMRRTLALLAAAVLVAAGPTAEARTSASKSHAPSHRAGAAPPRPLSAQASRATSRKPVAAKSKKAVYRAPRGASWAPYVRAAGQSGYVTITGHGRSWSGYVLGAHDRILPRTRERFSWVLASWRTGKQVAIDDRLIRLTAHISDVFGGRKIRIVSGYRERSHARNSRHRTGQALDFSIPGVPNEALRDFLKTLPNTGVGYYPRSTHVHVDVRDHNSYWVDYSRPGQGPVYGGVRPTHRLPPAGPPSRDDGDDEGIDPAAAVESEAHAVDKVVRR